MAKFLFVGRFLVLFLPAIFATRSNGCSEPEPIEHGSITTIVKGVLNSYQCNSGFTLYGTQHIRCQSDGQWSSKPPICVAPGCSPLPKFTRGRSFVRANGAVVSYRCNQGSWIKGSKTIFCDGTRWNDTVPTCLTQQLPDYLPISNCPDPPRAKNAIIYQQSFEYVAYRCVNSTSPTLGSPILRCLSNGQWSSEPVVCAKPGCSRLTDPENGYATNKHGFSVTEFRCFLNYHLLGSNILVCDGTQWNGTAPSCVRDISSLTPGNPSHHPGDPSESFTVQEGTTCSQARGVRNARVSYSMELDSLGATYWVADYICNVGYRLLRSGRLFCSRGVWVGERPQCVAHCGVNNGGCEHNCLNTNGRATCTCRAGYRLHMNGRSCTDINECAANSGRGPCDEICHNYAGNYICRCQRGYQLATDGHTCTAEPVDPCSRMQCTYGTCENVGGVAICTCPRGYSLARDRRRCADINECSRRVSPCEHTCRNTLGSYECLCPPGSVLLARGRCEECRANTYLSNNGRSCVPCPDGSVTSGPGRTSVADCTCRRGYEGNPERGRPCRDINECSNQNGGCEHSCVNIPGDFFCKCRPGYTLHLENQRTCIEIDECALNNGGCLHECRNSPGSFTCLCSEGYAVDPFDRYACKDVDECAHDSSRCEQVCVNSVGGFRCECNPGYRLNGDGRTCRAETCSPLMSPQRGQVNDSCGLSQGSAGLPVGSSCDFRCDKGYRLDGAAVLRCDVNGRWSGLTPSCVPIQCPAIPTPEFGRVVPDRCQQGVSEFRSYCAFMCDRGYDLLGKTVLKCLGNGEWSRRAPICSRDTQIRCPNDVTTILPRGSSQMVVNLTVADHSLDVLNSSLPLAGHVFSAGQTGVTFTAYTRDASTVVSCTMTITVEDREPPQVVDCPSSFTRKVEERYVTSLDLPLPVFSDNVAVTNISGALNHTGPVTWGTYIANYVARDYAGNIATCSFEVTIQSMALDCGVLDGPLNGNHFCNPWMYGQMCQPSCMHGYYYFDGPLSITTYVCGRDGLWNPSKRVPDCTAYELVTNFSVPCPSGKQLKVYSAVGGPACMDCPRGMYSTDLGPVAQPVCKLCPEGLYQDRTGQTSCLVCPTGTTTNAPGATSSRDCQSPEPGPIAEQPM